MNVFLFWIWFLICMSILLGVALSDILGKKRITYRDLLFFAMGLLVAIGIPSIVL